jgi:DNA-binding XRE family transcriptional regulator
MTVQIVEIAGQKIAMLPIADYQRLMEIVEDKADIGAAAEAEQRRLDGEDYLPAEMVDRIIAGESALKIWRKYRGLTLKQMSEASGASVSMLSEMENGKRGGRISLWRELATALDVTADDILPID